MTTHPHQFGAAVAAFLLAISIWAPTVATPHAPSASHTVQIAQVIA